MKLPAQRRRRKTVLLAFALTGLWSCSGCGEVFRSQAELVVGSDRLSTSFASDSEAPERLSDESTLENYRFEITNVTIQGGNYEDYWTVRLDTATGEIWQYDFNQKRFVKLSVTPPADSGAATPGRFRFIYGQTYSNCFLLDTASGRSWSSRKVDKKESWLEFNEVSSDGEQKQ